MEKFDIAYKRKMVGEDNGTQMLKLTALIKEKNLSTVLAIWKPFIDTGMKPSQIKKLDNLWI